MKDIKEFKDLTEKNTRIVEGVYTDALILTNNIEKYALEQIKLICDSETSKGSIIKVMPDVHPGKVGPIGLTMTLEKAVMPNIVGIDIGCGMTLAKLRTKKIEYQKLDKVIRENIPSGFKIRKKSHRFSDDFDFEKLKCFRHINQNKAILSMGTLGGGNHFIEIDEDDEKSLYVVVHSGSRSLGKSVAEYYLKEGNKILKEKGINVPYELTYLTDELMSDYLHDQKIVQKYAELNRKAILDEIVKGMKSKTEYEISCIHNYIEITSEYKMLRKGAISAKENEPVIIPINMRDGIILGRGKGNTEWNQSAPHGAGRLVKRSEVKNMYTVSNFKKEMKGIYSTCINEDTLDEAPFAYRRMDDITRLISETVEIEKILKPVYNFKAGGND